MRFPLYRYIYPLIEHMHFVFNVRNCSERAQISTTSFEPPSPINFKSRPNCLSLFIVAVTSSLPHYFTHNPGSSSVSTSHGHLCFICSISLYFYVCGRNQQGCPSMGIGWICSFVYCTPDVVCDIQQDVDTDDRNSARRLRIQTNLDERGPPSRSSRKPLGGWAVYIERRCCHPFSRARLAAVPIPEAISSNR